MSVLYRSQQENLMYSEMELMMESSFVSGSHSNSRPDDDDDDDDDADNQVEMMLERFICNYGSSSSSSPIFLKEEKEYGSGTSDHHQDQYHQSGDHHHSHDFNNVNSINRSDLIRQNSSPPQLFSHLTPQNNGFTCMRGGTRLGNDNQLNFSSGSPTRISSAHMPQIAENGKDSNWDNSSFHDLKRGRDLNDLNLFSNALENQSNTDFGNRGGLTHHLSLPRNFGMPTREKFLNFQGSVPCKMRAKRGFATHPRSIAERVRRTRISERMRRLEDLFPNIDKQTSIADKLELAVECIKDLQKQVKMLLDTKAKCSCSSKQKQHSNHRA